MPRRVPVNIIGGSYADDVLPFSSQECVNLIPEFAEGDGTRTPSMLRGVPGLYVYSEFGTGPVRGTHDVEGTLYVVSGQTLYTLDSDRTVTEIGTVGGVSRVAMAHNQVAGGNQVGVAAGSTLYVYDSSNDSYQTVSDDSFVGAKSLDFVDGYLTFSEPNGRFWGISGLADALSYSAIDRYDGETAPDKISTQIVLNREVLVFSQRTMEVFSDTGDVNNTFQRQNGVSVDIGTTAPYSVCRVAGTVCFLGNDGIVYMLNGYSPVRISTHAIEQAIAGFTASSAFAYAFEDRGHRVYYLTFPDGYTLGYDLSTRLWHRRTSYEGDTELSRWRLNTLTRWNGLYVGGDYNTGRLFALDWKLQQEVTLPLRRRRRGAVISDNQNRVQVSEVEIIAQVGQEAPDLPYFPTITGDVIDGYVGDTYSTSYVAANGVAPYTYKLYGSLPDGLSLNTTTGAVTGTATTAGDFTWVVQATDANGKTARIRDKATITELLMILASSAGEIIKSNGSFTSWTVKENSTSSNFAGMVVGPNGEIVVAQNTGTYIFQSTDDGETFTKYTTNISPTFVSNSITDLCYSSTQAAYFIVGAAGYAGDAGYVWKSTDGKTTWSNVSPASFQGGQTIAEHNGTVIAGGTNGVWRSTDGGSTWTKVSTISCEAIRYIDGAWFFARSTSGGTVLPIYKSTDDGVTLASVNAAPGMFVQVLVGDENYQFVFGTQNTSGPRIARSTDGYATLSTVYSTNQGGFSAFMGAMYGNRLISMGQSSRKVVYSSDTGTTWTLSAQIGTTGSYINSGIIKLPSA